MDTEKLQRSTTTDGRPPREGYEDAGAPAPIGPSGQHGAYWVLKPEERAKGFVRPVRDSYKHVGVRPQFLLRELSAEEHERYDRFGYEAYEAYPCTHIVDPGGPTPECRWPNDNERHNSDSPMFLHEFRGSNGSSAVGRFWTKDQLNSGCGSVTTMGNALAETYASDPGYYGSTFCAVCCKHLPVGEHGEFVWLDGSRVGS